VIKPKIICFDLDNTICTTKKNFYNLSKPKTKVVKIINDLYSKGFIIKIFTSRFMGRNNENIRLAKKQGLALTQNQLKKWKINYHSLIMGKPSYDIFIDDKMLGFRESWFNSFNINKHFSKKKNKSRL
tara:strand:+ start:951 stop:1334 length:384 start_codon:yes stop_codon:yes gene_type:complete